jgi:hypothetical protein
MSRKLHILLDANSIKKHLVNINIHDQIICGKGLSKGITEYCNVIELACVSNIDELTRFANVFNEVFNQAFSSTSEVSCSSQVNDIFKFIFVDLFEITKLINQLEVDRVYLYDGSKDVSFISIFLAANTEVSSPLLSSRSRILNPLLASWLSSKDNLHVIWKEESKYKLYGIKFLRNICIFSVSLITLVKTINLSGLNGQLKNIVLYRTTDQLVNLQYIKKLYPDTKFIQGPCLNNKVKKNNSSLISLKIILLSLWDAMKAKYKECRAGSEHIVLELNGYHLFLEKKAVMNEASYLLTSFAYYRGMLALFKSNKDLRYIFTSEVSSRYAVIEKIAKRKSEAKLVGIQFISVGNIILPTFPVQDKFLAKSVVEYQILTSLYSSRSINYVGNFLLSNEVQLLKSTVTKRTVIFYSQPYGHSDNLNIVKLVLSTLPENWKFLIRNHPRDNYDYSKISSLINLDKESHYLKELASSSIVISKSSSVLVEAIELKKITIPVALDNYTKGVIDSIIGKAIKPVYSINELSNVLLKSYSKTITLPSFTRDCDAFVSRQSLERVLSS